MPPRSSADRRRVFLVHGRDHSARDALAALLKAFDLKVIQWRDAAEYAGGGTPYTGDIVAAGMANADAVVVLLTPDDIGHVRPHLREMTDEQHEREPTGQARLNVVFEAGMAMARDRNRVVVVEVGQVRKMSDVDGLNIIRMDGSLERRRDLARRLRSAQLTVDTDSDDWRTAGSFVSGRLTNPRDGSEVNHQENVTALITGLGSEDHARIVVRSPRSGFWPQAELWPDQEGRFGSQATFGGNDESDDVKEYILMLVAAKSADNASLRASQGHYVSKLPSDVRVLDQATVKRRRPGSSGPGQNSLLVADNGIASDPYDGLVRNLPAGRRSRRILLQGDWGEQGNFELLVPHGNVIRQYYRDNDDPSMPWHYLRDFGYPAAGGQPGPTPRSVTFIQSSFRSDGQHGNLEAIVRVAPPVATEPDRLDFWWLDNRTITWNGPFPISADGTPIDGITGD